MRIVLSVISILLLLIIQLAFRNASLFILAPNFLIAFLCILLLWRDLEEVLRLSLLSGALLDTVSGLPDGVFAISLPLAIAAAWYMGQAFFSERFNVFLLPFYGVSATVIFFVAALLVLGGFALLGWVQVPAWLYFAVGPLLAAILLNLLAIIPAYGLYLIQEKIQKRFWPKHESI
jgi:hypothetical protein